VCCIIVKALPHDRQRHQSVKASISVMDDQGMIRGLTVFIKTKDSSMTSLFDGSVMIKVGYQHKSIMVNSKAHFIIIIMD